MSGPSEQPGTASTGAFPEHGRRELADLAETHALGRELGTALGAGDVVILTGPLGAGKTSLTQGLAESLAVSGRVTSPTFQLARRHPPMATGGPGLVHVDAYRLRADEDLDAAAEEAAAPGGDVAERAPSNPHALADELESLDLDQFLDADVVVIEWGEGLGEVLAERPWLVRLARNDAADTRTATWARGPEGFPGGPAAE